MAHECLQQETIGKIKEFMENAKGFKATFLVIAMTILLQVGTFLYLWGSLTTTVNQNTKQVWSELTPKTIDNAKSIAEICTQLKGIKLIGIAEAVDEKK